jgi:hypothetical protein
VGHSRLGIELLKVGMVIRDALVAYGCLHTWNTLDDELCRRESNNRREESHYQEDEHSDSGEADHICTRNDLDSDSKPASSNPSAYHASECTSGDEDRRRNC